MLSGANRLTSSPMKKTTLLASLRVISGVSVAFLRFLGLCWKKLRMSWFRDRVGWKKAMENVLAKNTTG